MVLLATSPTLQTFLKLAKTSSVSYSVLENLHFVIGMPFEANEAINNFMFIAKGLIFIEEYQGRLNDFHDYFRTHQPDSPSAENPWLAEYWKQTRAACDPSSTGASCQDRPANQKTSTTPLISQTIAAVYAYANALHDISRQHCGDKPAVTCFPLVSLEADMVANAIKGVSFVNVDGQAVAFDDNGNVEGQMYAVHNMQVSGSVPTFVNMGTWKRSSRLRLSNPFKFYDKFGAGLPSYPTSKCTRSCSCVNSLSELDRYDYCLLLIVERQYLHIVVSVNSNICINFLIFL